MENFAFAIPVAPYKNAAQWTRLNALLEGTLRSLLNQSDPNFVAYVAGHEEPPCVAALQDPRLQFLEVPFAKPGSPKEGRLDKTRKRWFIATQFRAHSGGYFMYLDGDDYVHRDLVKYILTDNNKIGYYIPAGYAFDYNNKMVAPIPGAFHKPFNHVCGSSGIVYFDVEDLPDLPFPHSQKTKSYFVFRNHSTFDKVVWKGSKLQPIPFPAGIYTLNNDLNVSNVLVRTKERQERLIRRIRIRSRKARLNDWSNLALRSDFGLDEITSLDREIATPRMVDPQPDTRGWIEVSQGRLQRVLSREFFASGAASVSRRLRKTLRKLRKWSRRGKR